MCKNNMVKRLCEHYTECNNLINEMDADLKKAFVDTGNDFRIQYNGKENGIKITVYNNEGNINHTSAYNMMKFIEERYGKFYGVVFTNRSITGEYKVD